MTYPDIIDRTKITLSDPIMINDQEILASEKMAIQSISNDLVLVTLGIFASRVQVSFPKIANAKIIAAQDIWEQCEDDVEEATAVVNANEEKILEVKKAISRWGKESEGSDGADPFELIAEISKIVGAF